MLASKKSKQAKRARKQAAAAWGGDELVSEGRESTGKVGSERCSRESDSDEETRSAVVWRLWDDDVSTNRREPGDTKTKEAFYNRGILLYLLLAEIFLTNNGGAP